MNDFTAALVVAKKTTEVRCERINPKTFDGFVVAMPGIEPAAALRVAEVLPVGGFIAGTKRSAASRQRSPTERGDTHSELASHRPSADSRGPAGTDRRR